jgi:predicted O-linked N-acetylglucosamine transferase (SPINDLY family)
VTEQPTADHKDEDLAWLAGLARGGTKDDLAAAGPDEVRERLGRIAFFDLLTALVAEPGRNRLLAAELYREWIGHQPDSPMRHAAWFNMGVELWASGDPHNAAIAYRNALIVKPDMHQAAINLGLMQETVGDRQGALDTWKSALQPDDTRVLLLNNLGRLNENVERLDAAEAALRQSLRINPHQPDVIQHWVHIRQKACQWPVLAVHQLYDLDAQRLAVNAGPLTALALFDDIPTQHRIAEVWVHRKVPAAPSRLSPPEGYRHDRIRVGYLSSDFRDHAMAFLVAELFERHDRATFEVYGYCITPDDGSAVRQRLIGAFDHFRVVRDLGDAAAAQQIRDDEIDILIDLNGLTAGARIGILRRKPAPVQATYLGYIGPLPLPELDYLLCDSYVVPPELADSYLPKPLYIEGIYQANDTHRPVRDGLTRRDVGLPEDRFLFCCFANHYKITEATFRLWLSILLRTNDTALWLIDDSEVSRNNLTAYAANNGVAPDRLIFTPRAEPADYLARLRLADLYLDTHPYNAGTVASDALRVGLPLLTLNGQSFVSRMAGCLLTAVGLEDLVAPTPDAYIEIAASLAGDPARYQAVRERLVGAWSGSLGDVALFTRRFEAALASVVKRPGETEP